MGTTPRGIPTPDDTAYVAEGAAAIRALAAALDAELTEVESGAAARLDVVEDQAVPRALVDAKGDLLVATGPDTVARQAVGVDGQALVADSSKPTGLAWQAASKPSTTQTFTVGGTWTKPAGAVRVSILCVAGGTAGASGQITQYTQGGVGGAGGNVAHATLDAASVPASVPVTVGAGGLANTSPGMTSSNIAGGVGGLSSFGTLLDTSRTRSGGDEVGGTGGQGAYASTPAAPVSVPYGAGGGGGGGSAYAAPNATNGAPGGAYGGAGGAGGSTSGTSSTSVAYNGSNGTFPGGGGGGGGSTSNSGSNPPGRGGHGAAGVVVVTTYYS